MTAAYCTQSAFRRACSSPVVRLLKKLKVGHEIRPDGRVYVQTLDLRGRNLNVLPDLSDVIVEGDFDCSQNNLTNLLGAPRVVQGNFYCHINKLNSLKGAPHTVEKSFVCAANRLRRLRYGPRVVGGDFNCAGNDLISIAQAPCDIGGNFNCGKNALLSLRGVPGTLFCTENKLLTLHGIRHVLSVMSDFGCFLKQGDIPPELTRDRLTPTRRARDIFNAMQQVNGGLTARQTEKLNADTVTVSLGAKKRLRFF